MASPTLIAFSEADTLTVTAQASASLTWQTGDILVAIGMTEGVASTWSTPTNAGSGLSWVQQQLHNSGGTAACGLAVWTAIATAGSSGAVTVNQTVAQQMAIGVYQFRAPSGGSIGVGVSSLVVTPTSTAGSYSAPITMTSADSSVVWASTDTGGAAVPTGRTPTATVHGAGTPGPTASPFGKATNSTYAMAELDDQASTGSQSYGFTGSGASTANLLLAILEITFTPAATAATFPVFLPRRLGPNAVGPTFFARFPPGAPGVTPIPGLVIAPAYLPRRLGPKAAGPTFFAPIQQPQPLSPQQAPAPIWLPPYTYPSIRNRTFFVVCGRRVVPVPAADPPIPYRQPRAARRETARLMRGQRPFPVQPQIPVPPIIPGNRTSSEARRLFALIPRGKRPFPVQAQIAVPPTIPGNRSPAGRRWVLPVRGRRSLPTPPQDPVWPTRIESIRSRLTMLRRGRQVSTVPAQVTVPPTIPGNRWSSARSKFLMLRRGSRPFTPQPTTPPVLAWPPPKLGAPRRLLSAPTRPRRTPVPADQHAPLRAAHPRYGLVPRRGHHVTVTPPQIAVPPTRVPRIATRWRWAAVRRGHQTNPVLTQIVVFLTPPCITPPTTAAIMAYFSRAAVSAYTATAAIMAYFSVSSINAYASDGDIFSYAASPAIVSYSSKAGIVTYTSTSRIGPRFCP